MLVARCNICNNVLLEEAQIAISRVNNKEICTRCAHIEALVDMYHANFNNSDINNINK